MEKAPEIIDFHKVVEPHLNGGKLISYKSRYLTKPGENYGSCMLSILANIKRPNDEIEEHLLVAKLPPLTNDLYWQLFQPERTCLTENAVYKNLSPALRQLQLEAGISEQAPNFFDAFPRYFGSRISLDPGAKVVDRDAVLVLENLQTSGFKAGNREKMFDMPHVRCVLETLAQYHALPIALRLKKPEEFDANIRPFFGKFNMATGLSAEAKKQMDDEAIYEVELATNNNKMSIEEVKKFFEIYNQFSASTATVADTIFTTLVHFDMWVNNMMVQYDECGAPSKLKIVDFQIAQYESLAHDVIFFLLSSVEIDVLDQHFDDCLRIYFEAFKHCLESVGVPTAEYTYATFLKEIHRVAPIEIPHVIFMTKVILADNSTIPKDFKSMDLSVLTKNSGVGGVVTQRTGDIVRIMEKLNFINT